MAGNTIFCDEESARFYFTDLYVWCKYTYQNRIKVKVNDLYSLQRYLNGSKYGQKISGQNGDLNPDLCYSGALLYQLNYHDNWVTRIKYKPINAKIIRLHFNVQF